MTELSDAIASKERYDVLTPAERAVAEKNPHLSFCREPELGACRRCQWELDNLREVLRLASPVIEETAYWRGYDHGRDGEAVGDPLPSGTQL